MAFDVQAELSFLAELLGRLKDHAVTAWEKYGPLGFEKLTLMWAEQPEVRINAEDDGVLRCYVKLANLTRSDIEFLDLHLETVRLAGVYLREVQPTFSSNGRVVTPRDEARVGFRLNLASKDIRRLGRQMKDAQNEFTSPDNPVEVDGFFRIRAGSKRRKLPFEFRTVPKYYVSPGAVDLFAT